MLTDIQKVSEKTLEINICDNLVDCIRSSNPLFRNAYWRGITLRLEKRIGLDVKLEAGGYNSYIVLGLQFKRAKKKSYDFQCGKHYYLFEINNNSANDQHLLLWFISHLLHTSYPGKFVFVGYAFPMFIDYHEMSRASPNFLWKTVFVDALDIPVSKLDRLSHEVYVYEGGFNVMVASEKKIEVTKRYVGEELIEKLIDMDKDRNEDKIKGKILSINDIRRISSSTVTEVIGGLRNIAPPDVVEHVKRKIDKGWQMVVNATLIPASKV